MRITRLALYQAGSRYAGTAWSGARRTAPARDWQTRQESRAAREKNAARLGPVIRAARETYA